MADEDKPEPERPKPEKPKPEHPPQAVRPAERQGLEPAEERKRQLVSLASMLTAMAIVTVVAVKLKGGNRGAGFAWTKPTPGFVETDADIGPEAPLDPKLLEGIVVDYDTLHGTNSQRGSGNLEARGARTTVADRPLSDKELAEVSVLVIANARMPFAEEEIDAIDKFVRSGHGLIIADDPSMWAHVENRPLEELPPNVLGARLGFSFGAKLLGAPARIDSAALGGIARIARNDWVPTSVTTDAGHARPLALDDQAGAMLVTAEPAKGRIVVVGHPSMLADNPALFVWAVKWAAGR